MKDAFYFKHDDNASSDLKLRALRKNYGWKGYGWFWFLCEQLRSEDDFKLEHSDFVFDSLAANMNCKRDTTKDFIDYCISIKLFEQEDGYFFSSRLNRDMKNLKIIQEQRREAGRKSARMRLKDSANSTTVEQPLNDRSTSRVEYSRVEKNRIKESSSSSYVTPGHENFLTSNKAEQLYGLVTDEEKKRRNKEEVVRLQVLGDEKKKSIQFLKERKQRELARPLNSSEYSAIASLVDDAIRGGAKIAPDIIKKVHGG